MALPSPNNFRKFNVDQDPSALVHLKWDAYTEGQLGSATQFETNNALHLTNDAGFVVAPGGGGINHIGFRLHRSPTMGFTPSGTAKGLGNCIEDENVLDNLSLAFIDTDVAQEDTWYYLLSGIEQT